MKKTQELTADEANELIADMETVSNAIRAAEARLSKAIKFDAPASLQRDVLRVAHGVAGDAIALARSVAVILDLAAQRAELEARYANAPDPA